MSALTIPAVAFTTALTVLVVAFGVRRLMGLPLSPLRTLIAALIAFFVTAPITTAIGGTTLTRRAGLLPGLWFIILGVVIALLVGMIFLVIAEALVPSGSMPGPIYVIRGARRQLGRARRYAQISRILVRRGLLPYLRGGRRSELATADGRTRLARSLRLALEDGRGGTGARGSALPRHPTGLGLRALPGRSVPSSSRSPSRAGRPAVSIFRRTWPSSCAMKRPPAPVKPACS